MSADLIVYALVAAGLIFWLRSILGTRHGDEKSRPNPYVSSADAPSDLPLDTGHLPEERPPSPAEKIQELLENPIRGMSIDNKTAELGLMEIIASDRNFDINFFLEGAQEAFAIIVEAFGEGDRDTLKGLLSPSVYEAFDGAITQREKDEHTMQTEIHAIQKAEIIEARMDKKLALITVRFTADETTVTRDADDAVIAGHPDKVTKMRDVWVFGRDVKSRDPRWLVHETRGDFDGDNETIPNSDD